MNLEMLRKSVGEGNLDWKKHVVQRLLERGISRLDVIRVLLEGEIIRKYPDNYPCPSALFLGFVANRPIHIVAAYDEISQMTHIITAYEPSSALFEDDFKTKRQL